MTDSPRPADVTLRGFQQLIREMYLEKDLARGIDGTFKGNRHLVFPDNQQRTSNMLLSILHLFGIPQDKIGTSTGALQPLEMA